MGGARCWLAGRPLISSAAARGVRSLLRTRGVLVDRSVLQQVVGRRNCTSRPAPVANGLPAIHSRPRTQGKIFVHLRGLPTTNNKLFDGKKRYTWGCAQGVFKRPIKVSDICLGQEIEVPVKGSSDYVIQWVVRQVAQVRSSSPRWGREVSLLLGGWLGNLLLSNHGAGRLEWIPPVDPTKPHTTTQTIHPAQRRTQTFSKTCVIDLDCEAPYFMNPLLAACQVRRARGAARWAVTSCVVAVRLGLRDACRFVADGCLTPLYKPNSQLPTLTKRLIRHSRRSWSTSQSRGRSLRTSTPLRRTAGGEACCLLLA
jgi:hypothetical protein